MSRTPIGVVRIDLGKLSEVNGGRLGLALRAVNAGFRFNRVHGVFRVCVGFFAKTLGLVFFFHFGSFGNFTLGSLNIFKGPSLGKGNIF